MNLFESFIKAVADWEMKTPQFYGWFHLLWMGITLIVCTLILIFRDKISPKAVDATLIVWGAVLIALEVLKQLTVSFSYKNGQVVWDYAWWAFPFQFCSCPLYLALPAGILRKGKIKTALQSALASYALFAGIVVMIYPGNVFSSNAFLNVHSMFWHSSMVSVCSLLLATRTVKPCGDNLLKAFVVFFIMAGIALILNVIIKNTIDVPGFNMFFVSPYEPFEVPIVKWIYESVPYPVYLLLYLIGFTAAAGLMFAASYGANKLIDKR